jgi:hypothetical protein
MLAPLRGKHADRESTGQSRALDSGVESDVEESREPLACLPRKAGASMAHRIHTFPRTHTVVHSFDKANALRGIARM